jgi:hypothetical protein
MIYISVINFEPLIYKLSSPGITELNIVISICISPVHSSLILRQGIKISFFLIINIFVAFSDFCGITKTGILE